MRITLVLVASAALASVALAATAGAQDSLETRVTTSRVPIPVRQLASKESADTTRLTDVSSVRHLPNGSVIVNDVQRRQLVVYDKSLQQARIIADTSSNSPNPYGLRTANGSLIPYQGDSTLFIDLDSQAFLVIDGAGTFARVMAPVRASDMFLIASSQYGASQFDAKGRLFYRGIRRNSNDGFEFTGGNSRRVTTEPDSAPILRMDFDKRSVDSVAFLKISAPKSVFISTSNMAFSRRMINPLPVSDEWTLLPDGTIAIVRGQDYHVDLIAPDGKRTSGPRLPFDWRRITKEDKQAIIDSVRKADAERVAKLPPAPPSQFSIPQSNEFVEPSELPDYYPPVRQGQVRADYEGNLWILPSTSKDAKNGLLYDVVNREGALVERVQLPKDRTLVGFGPGGVLYLSWVRAPGKATLERATVAR
ncbi:MAG: hypothetical protein K2R93_01695 [Gemmatimonadaceae bacterium]|nr:hypothetical protein [Gemmatimonadaceae bacterium]